jgi:hypothetical protein
MKGVLPWLVRWACRASTRNFLSCLGCSIRPSSKYVFPHCPLFQFICPHRPASWAGSRAGSSIICGETLLCQTFSKCQFIIKWCCKCKFRELRTVNLCLVTIKYKNPSWTNITVLQKYVFDLKE